jgi:hypothetical protein
VFGFVPFRIELRKYNQHKKENKTGVIKYLISILEVEYGMPNVPEKKLKELFSGHPSIMFFDGLDEIFNIEEKVAVKNDIELFALNYPNARVVVTSRIIGYEEVKLKSSLFIDISIIPFDESQIKKYVTQWYEEEESDEVLRKSDVEGFLSHMHEIDGELITNPLLLSLIVILYRNNLKIPESKLEIYQSCTKTLVDKWDGSKELTLVLDESLSKRKESIFADLAYWHYTQAGAENTTITNARVQETITETIINKLGITDDYIVGSELAEKFLEYAQKRSLYFDNNFTHKTFLEYFTAFWIYSNIEKKHKVAERNEIVSKYISSNFWYVVLELLLNMIDDNQADNEILDDLLLEQIDNKNSYPFLLIVVPTIKNISAKVLDRIYLNALRFELNDAYDSRILSEKPSANKRAGARRRDVFEYFARTFNTIDIKGNFLKAFESLYQEVCDAPDKLLLYFIMYDELLLSSDESPKTSCRHVSESLKQGEKYNESVKTDSYLCLLDIYCETYILKNKFSNRLLEAINTFGGKVFFQNFEGIFSRFGLSYSGLFFNQYLNATSVSNFKEVLMQLENAGVPRSILYAQLKARTYVGYFHSDFAIELLPLISSDNEPITNATIIAVFYQTVVNGDMHIQDKKQAVAKHIVQALENHEFVWLKDLFAFPNKKEVYNLIESELGLGKSIKRVIK